MFEILYVFIISLFLLNLIVTVAIYELPKGYPTVHYRTIAIAIAKVAAGMAAVNLIVSIALPLSTGTIITYVFILIGLILYVFLQEKALLGYEKKNLKNKKEESEKDISKTENEADLKETE